MSREILTNRQFNRATLARQMLLARERQPIPEAVRFLGGLQAQQSNDPVYWAVESRLNGFGHETADGADRRLRRVARCDDLDAGHARISTRRRPRRLSARWCSRYLDVDVEEQLPQALWRAGRRPRCIARGEAPQEGTNDDRARVGKALHEKFPGGRGAGARTIDADARDADPRCRRPASGAMARRRC